MKNTNQTAENIENQKNSENNDFIDKEEDEVSDTNKIITEKVEVKPTFKDKYDQECFDIMVKQEKEFNEVFLQTEWKIFEEKKDYKLLYYDTPVTGLRAFRCESVIDRPNLEVQLQIKII